MTYLKLQLQSDLDILVHSTLVTGVRGVVQITVHHDVSQLLH